MRGTTLFFLAVPLALAGCWEDKPMRDKAYYLQHRDELESSYDDCRNTGKAMTDETCIRLGGIKTEILKDDVGARIQAR